MRVKTCQWRRMSQEERMLRLEVAAARSRRRMVLAAIKRVINRRRRRGATEADIQEYKKHLLEIWKNPELQKEIMKL